ncbi:MAG: methionine--tRNA ligase [Candidatus Shapirobacteria bacterium]|jgi:methionyl-tRNA synthetase
MDQITYADFSKVEFRVGQIIEAVCVPKSEKLIRMRVDFGELGVKTVYSGIHKWYEPEELIDKKTVFVVNMVPKKIMGEESEAMIFAADDEENGMISILLLEKDMKNGVKVF